MTSRSNQFIFFISLFLGLNACSVPFNNSNMETEQKTVVEKCGKDVINQYLNEGWNIKEQNTKQVNCAWKTEQATKGCNVDLDKGCRVKTPIVGEEIEYLIERPFDSIENQ